MKIIDKSGITSARLFQRVSSPRTCHWIDCPTCKNTPAWKHSNCRTSNIVYEASFLECMKQVKEFVRDKNDIGKYIGESSRTLAERSREHVLNAGNFEYESFIIKHWVKA